jgi:hypothetical protein
MFSYLKRSNQDSVTFAPVESQVIWWVPSSDIDSFGSALARCGGLLTRFDVSQCLFVVELSVKSRHRLTQLVPTARSLTVLRTHLGDEVLIHPGLILVGTPDGGISEAVAEHLDLTLGSRAISEGLFEIQLSEDIDPFTALQRIPSDPRISLAEPVFVSFDPEEGSVSAFNARCWGRTEYLQKSFGKSRKYSIAPDKFVVIFSATPGEDAGNVLAGEGLAVEYIDQSESVAIVANSPSARGLTTRSESLQYLRQLQLREKRRDLNSIVESIFPVLIDPAGLPAYVQPGECIVKIAESTNSSATSHALVLEFLDEHQLSISEEIAPFVFRCLSKTPDALFFQLERLVSESIVDFAEPVFREFVPHDGPKAPSDPEYFRQWNLSLIGAERAWLHNKGVEKVVIVVPDQGVDMLHPDLQGQFIEQGSDKWNWVRDIPRSPHDRLRTHGTFICGLVAAKHDTSLIAGLAPGCKLLPIKMYEQSITNATESAVLSYINSVASAHPECRYVVSLSYHTSQASEASASVIAKGEALGVVYAASAGNSGLQDVPHFPSDYPFVLSIASVGPQDIISSHWVNGGSNSGDRVDLCAPGGDGPVDGPDSVLGLAPVAGVASDIGTSFASPHVAAAAALLLSLSMTLGKSLQASDVRTILKSTSKSIDVLNAAAFHGKLGSGRLDVGSAMDYVANEMP